jgi:calcineurin-like phosphoesterase family protein
MEMYFFTADEHYGHQNIIRYCCRPFQDTDEMDRELISRHNTVVGPGDTVIHAGDFTLKNRGAAQEYIKQLNGSHIFLRGSHDDWLRGNSSDIWKKTVEGNPIVVCHFAMRVWPGSHYNSLQLYGHSHGRLEPAGKQWDIGVDNNNFYPVSFRQLVEIMKYRPDNMGLL